MGQEEKGTAKAVETEAAEAPVVKRGRKKADPAAVDPAAKKAPAEKKAPAKKVEPKVGITIEFAGKQVATKDILAAVQKAYKKANRGAVIKKIDIYVKPEENAAYYVVNGEGSADYKIEL